MFRRFGRTHCRILLHLEAEITTLENKLDTLDIHDSQNSSFTYRLRSNSWNESWDREQKDLLKELKTKLLEYGESAKNCKGGSRIVYANHTRENR